MNNPERVEVIHSQRVRAGDQPHQGDTVDGVMIELETQPIPDDVAEACAWLSAAERRTGQLRDRIAAGDVLDILLDVDPPYPPIDTSRPVAPLAAAAPHVITALERELQAAEASVVYRLRIARAMARLRKAML